MFASTSVKARKQISSLITNKWALGCCATLTIQQMMEASATLWLVLLMKNITSGESFFNYLILYLSTLVLPYFPWCLAHVQKITWRQEAQRSFVNAFVASNRNNIAEWGNKNIKQEKLSVLTSEGPTAIIALVDYLFEFFSYALSVIFNIIALSIAVEPLFAVAYGFSVTIVFLIMKFKRKTQQWLTNKAVSARIDLSQSLLAAWDNVLLGNRYNFNLWEERTKQRLNRCLQKNVDLERFDQIMAVVVSLLTSIPSLIVVVYYVFQNQNDPVKLSAFIVTLPILFQILNYTYNTLSLAFRWGMHKSKLMALYKTIQVSNAHVDLEKKVKWSKIKMIQPEKVSHALTSHIDLVNQTDMPGRVTLRGDNGAGKSTLLMLVKHELNNRAFFLPTHNQLSFSADANKHSTGESLKNRLIEIIDKVDVDVLLLDEWDANLDEENQKQLSALIDTLATKKCVIEVRHR